MGAAPSASVDATEHAFSPPAATPRVPAADPLATSAPSPPGDATKRRVSPPTSPSDEALASSPPGRASGEGWQPPVAEEWIVEPPVAGGAVVTSAAVLGRAGEVEPVAAALALALRRESRSKVAGVAVIGAHLPDTGEGGGAARRLGARLEAQGFEARVRGRLVWVRLDPDDPQLASAARRMTLVAAPAVLAVTAPRTPATDEALAEQDLLVIVAADPEGPLARLAAAGLTGAPVVTVRPLGRGPARALSRAGVRPARLLRRLLATAQEQCA
jgi:hypothetical protein